MMLKQSRSQRKRSPRKRRRWTKKRCKVSGDADLLKISIELLADHRAKKAQMIEDENKLHFSYDLQVTQTEDEKLANEKLQKLKGDLLTPLYNVVLHNFFENKEAVALYDAHLRFMVGRNNTITGQAYAEDPTIMTWELANEPRGMAKGEAFFDWVQSTSKLIKALDPNHLVTIGLEGDTIDPKYNGINFELLNSPESIDYTTIHIWVENWKWYNPYHAGK